MVWEVADADSLAREEARPIVVLLAVGLLAFGALALDRRADAGADAAPAADASINPMASPEPTIDLAPVAAAQPPPGECLAHITSYDSLPRTVESLASISTGVILGTVEDVGPARWRTDGEMTPTEQQELDPANVMRMLRLRVDADLAGESSDQRLVVWVMGGWIGCHRFEHPAAPLEIEPGDRYVFFLDARQTPLATIDGVARVMEMWPVTGDVAASSAEGAISAGEIRSIASARFESRRGAVTPPLIASSAAPPPGADCYVLHVEAGHAPTGVNDLRRDATDVIVAAFLGYGQSRWNTPDGHRPTLVEFRETPARLMRPLRIDASSEIRGGLSVGENPVQRGGSSGCDQISYGDDVTLDVGRRYVLFFMPVRMSDGRWSDDRSLIAAWPVDADDRVQTPSDGILSMADLANAVKDGLPATPAPSPGEPEPTTPG